MPVAKDNDNDNDNDNYNNVNHSSSKPKTNGNRKSIITYIQGKAIRVQSPLESMILHVVDMMKHTEDEKSKKVSKSDSTGERVIDLVYQTTKIAVFLNLQRCQERIENIHRGNTSARIAQKRKNKREMDEESSEEDDTEMKEVDISPLYFNGDRSKGIFNFMHEKLMGQNMEGDPNYIISILSCLGLQQGKEYFTNESSVTRQSKQKPICEIIKNLHKEPIVIPAHVKNNLDTMNCNEAKKWRGHTVHIQAVEFLCLAP